MLGPAGLFTAELSALFTAQRHIVEIVRPWERCLIHTDSLCSIKAMLSRKLLCQNEIEVKLMWIPSYAAIVGNELVDADTTAAALEGSIFERPLSPSEFHQTDA
jgi:hypothetical protein